MALNQNDAIVVMASAVMQNRCSWVVANYALYVLGFPTATEGQATKDGSNNRIRSSPAEKAWASGALQDLTSVGRKLSVFLLNNADFLASGSDVTDNQLKAAGETMIDTYLIVA